MGGMDVAIGIVAHKQRILIAQRTANAPLGGFWEYPGGKVLPGEREADCLVREMREETGLLVRPVHSFSPIEYSYEHGAVRLHPFLCEVVSGQAQPLVAAEVRWVRPDELRHYSMPPANDALNQEVIRILKARGLCCGVEE